MRNGETGTPSQRGRFKKLTLKASVNKRAHPVFSPALSLSGGIAGSCDSRALPASSDSFVVFVMLDSDIKLSMISIWICT